MMIPKYMLIFLAFACADDLNLKSCDEKVENAFKAHQVVPDVIPKAPKECAYVKYPTEEEARLGNELTPVTVRDNPAVFWNASPENCYLLAMVGDILAEYVSPSPGPGSGPHRYVFLVYQQPARTHYDEPRRNDTSLVGRTNFSIKEFASKYKLGEPIAGNFFQASYDPYVPFARARLGDYSLLPCLTGLVECK